MVKSQFRFPRLAVLCACALACAKDKTPRTELLLVADTDISDLDSIRFEVEGDSRSENQESALRDDGKPLTLGLVLDKGSLGPLTVSALGIRNGQTVVTRNAVVSFVRDKTLVVALHLVASCETRSCLPGRTCTERGCEASQQTSETLSEWTGSPPTLAGTLLGDAGSPDDGSAKDAAVDANRAGDASNLVTCGADTKVDLTSDVSHCGSCSTSCKATGRNMVAACMAGECTEECRIFYGDCDGNVSNGCEQSLLVSTHCSICGMRCATGTTCTLGACR